LERQDGTRVLINRGWVASEFKDRTTRPESLESGEVVVKGLFRRTDETSSFVPKNRPDKNEWYSVDVAEMSEHAQTQPMFLDSIYEDVPGMEMHYMKHGIPLGRRAKVDLRNNHVEYIITWYSLAVITGVMFLTL
jgi:surfeit locus 1 family protein